ncbi:MAG: hypothetical protein QM703_19345 [Gemmatales bacterium]
MNGSQTSNIITILGVPALLSVRPPQSQYGWGEGTYLTGGESPTNHEGIPDEGNPKYISVSSKNWKPRSHHDQAKLLQSEAIPESLRDESQKCTSETLATAWGLTRRYYQDFCFAHSVKAIASCLKSFANFVQEKAIHAVAMSDFFEQRSVLKPGELQDAIRDGRIPPQSTTPWELVKHLKAQALTTVKPVITAASQPSLQKRKQRQQQSIHSSATLPNEVNAVTAPSQTDLTLDQKDSHVRADQPLCIESATP